MSGSITLVPVESQEQVELARRLFREYADAIGADLEYQGFTAELEALPLPYTPPYGALLFAQINGDTGGCVALRRLNDETGEMKRLAPSIPQLGTGQIPR